jgi:hypothetical protein
MSSHGASYGAKAYKSDVFTFNRRHLVLAASRRCSVLVMMSLLPKISLAEHVSLIQNTTYSDDNEHIAEPSVVP